MRALRIARPPDRPFPGPALVGALERTAQTEAERRLVARLRAGDPAALDPLIAAHASRVYRVALGITGRADRAEGVVRAVFGALVNGGASLDGPGGLPGWLYRATTWVALRTPADLAPKRGGPPWPTPGDESPQTGIRRALAGLAAADRAAVILKDGEGLPDEGVAHALRESPSIVRGRIHRARLHLCARLRAGLAAGTPTAAG